MIMASYRTFSDQIDHLSSQIKFGQTNLLYIINGKFTECTKEMNIRTIFSFYHKQCGYYVIAKSRLLLQGQTVVHHILEHNTVNDKKLTGLEFGESANKHLCNWRIKFGENSTIYQTLVPPIFCRLQQLE